MEELLRATIDKFNARAEKDERVRAELEGVVRKVRITTTEGDAFRFVVRDGGIQDFAAGDIDEPHVSIESDRVTLEALLKGEMAPMKALVKGKLKIQASLEDLLRLRKFF